MNPLIPLITLALTAAACTGSTATTGSDTPSDTPTFNTDSAMAYLKAQTSFGPRIPGTTAHTDCGHYLTTTLQRHGADTIITHTATATAWNGDHLPLLNILARFNPSDTISPILLLAHWDTRPWADNDPDPTHSTSPIDGANDGASGVAILLEIARLAATHNTTAPLDILFVDGEDYGAPDGTPHSDTTWCLGTQQWLATTPYAHRPQPRYAILLDMVGGRDARFHREYISTTYAPHIVDLVWNRAATLGLADRFVNTTGGAVVDDHLFLNQASIPAIDIIENHNPATGSFNPTWHTHHDTYDNIDPATIADVGTLITSLCITTK